MKTTCLCLAAALLGFARPAPARDPLAISLRWEEIGRLIEGKQIAVAAPDGSTRKGRVRAVDPEGISFEDRGTPRIGRAAISEIRLIEYVGSGRRFGKLIGGTAGLTIGLCAAAVLGLREGSGRRTGDKVLIGVVGIGGLPLGTLAGYLVGRKLDRQETIIRIIPSQMASPPLPPK